MTIKGINMIEKVSMVLLSMLSIIGMVFTGFFALSAMTVLSLPLVIGMLAIAMLPMGLVYQMLADKRREMMLND